MAEGVLMPKEGITVESCIIGEWKKNVGDHVNVGDVLFTYETDKAEFECESTAAGTLIEKFYEDGDEVPCLVNVCAIGNPGEDPSALKNAPAATAAPAAAAPAGPCAQAVIMPKEGITVESCIIGEWKKNVGDAVNVGDILFTYETDKAEFNWYNVHYLYTHVVGTSGGNTSDMKEAIEMMTSGKINPAAMITHIGGLNAVVDTVLNLPKIPGGKKLIYTQIELPLTAIADFGKLGETDPLFAKLDEITRRNNGLWSAEAEKYLLANK